MADSPPRRKLRTEAEATTVVPPDLLSQLPLEVLDKILSLLHIYDVVRTSVLSHAWRRRWETLPTVSLFGIPPIPADEVDVILLRRTAPLRNFRLAACRHWYVDALHDWLLYLSRNGVEKLHLWFPPVGFRLHSRLFSCHELTSLNLTSCRLPPTPAGFAGFPNLKTLQFSKVTIPQHGGKQLAALISGSPLIESVKLVIVELIGDDPEAEDEWVIRAPNLRELTIASRFPYGGRVEDLPRLQKGVLVGCNYAKFLKGMAQIKELEFACGADWGWSDGSEVFNADDKFLNAQWVDGMFAKLHVVRMKDIRCIPNEMHFVEFILSKAMVLQMLSVRLGPDSLCSIEEAVITIKEYTKASPDAQVIFLGSESTNAGPINVSTENAVTRGVKTTGRENDSINTPTEDAEMERQTEDGKCASISASTEKDEAEETQTTVTGCVSINKSTANAKVDETQTTSSEHECINASTENAEVEETHTSGSELVNDVRPRRRHRLDLESVAQLEQLEVDMRELQEIMQLHLDCRRLALKRRTQVLDSVVGNLKYRSCLKDLSNWTNVSLPPFPEPSQLLSSLLATSRTGDSPVDIGVNGATSIHVDSSEDHGVNGADNAQPDP